MYLLTFHSSGQGDAGPCQHIAWRQNQRCKISQLTRGHSSGREGGGPNTKRTDGSMKIPIGDHEDTTILDMTRLFAGLMTGLFVWIQTWN
jgi:hypothetical protein